MFTPWKNHKTQIYRESGGMYPHHERNTDTDLQKSTVAVCLPHERITNTEIQIKHRYTGKV
jgi:hypothetical protein